MEEKKNYKPIGVFDSGIGGLTVLKRLVNLRPDLDYIYFGDTKNLPYGEKTKEELLKITRGIFDFFEEKNVSSVVMACNTSSAQVYEELKDVYSFKLYPIIQTASKCIAKDRSIKKIAIFATNGTIKSGMYAKSLKFNNTGIETLEIACPEWVSIVEKKIKDTDKDDLLLKYLKPALEFNPDKIILGCTHYPYLLERLSKYAPKAKFIDPAETFSEFIAEDICTMGVGKTAKRGSRTYYVSANPDEFIKNASVFYNIETPVELKSI